MNWQSEKKQRKIFLLVSIMIVTWTVNSQAIIIRSKGTNRQYRQGDWITYTTTRFVRNIALGQEYVYFATTGGITRYNFYSNTWDYPWTVSNGLPDNNIFLVAQDFNTGYLWCTSESSISYLESASRLWFNTFYDEIGLRGDDDISSIGFGNGRVFIVSSNGTWYASDNYSANFSPIDFSQNDDGITWYGAKRKREDAIPHYFMSDGFLFDETQNYIDDLQFRHFPITTWLKDEWQNMWIGTWGLGAGRGNTSTQRLELLKFGLWDVTVDAIAKDDDRFWLGGIQSHEEPSGITNWDMQSDDPQYYEAYLLTGFDTDKVTSIAVDGNTVWLGTLDGLTRFDRGKNIWRTYTVVHNLVDNRISDLAVDDQYLWIGTASGVSKLVKSTVGTDSLSIKHIQFHQLGKRQIFDIDLGENELWVGTEIGLFRYDIEKDHGAYYSSYVDPAARPVYALSLYGDELWYGTDEGVAGFNVKTGKRFDPPARFINDDLEINRILADRAAVWVATNSGVYKYDRDAGRWVNFTIEDGLTSNNVYALYLESDFIWFGTGAGLTKFYWNSPYRID